MNVRIGSAAGVSVIGPEGAPSVLDAECGVDVLVLEVAGGHLTWSLLGEERIPVAVIDDLDSADDWLWAVFGEEVAVAAAERRGGELTDERGKELPNGRGGEFVAEPAEPQLLTDAWRLAYALWAARWWPASIIDGIPALDPELLAAEIATLTEACDLLVDGADAVVPEVRAFASTERQQDYALAAGGERGGSGLTVARGVGGWDWRGCPPGLVDASERAVSWEVIRDSGATLVTVRATAAPLVAGPVPAHLRPRAVVGDAPGTEIDLTLIGDTWLGRGEVPVDSVATVDLRVPGVGYRTTEDAATRQRVRDLAAARLNRAANTDDSGFDAPLLAEIAAAASDTDF